MGVLLYFLLLIGFGFFVGAFARLALPGPDPMSVTQTTAIGLAGTIVAGLISWGIWGREYGGLAFSILVATVIVYFVRRGRGGGLIHPRRPRDERS